MSLSCTQNKEAKHFGLHLANRVLGEASSLSFKVLTPIPGGLPDVSKRQQQRLVA